MLTDLNLAERHGEFSMISVLMYHQVDSESVESNPAGFAVTPTMFEKHMSHLYRNGYQCLSLSAAVDCWEQGKAEPKKAFVLTFDDGFQDIYTTAYPILQKFGFTATVFLVADQMDGLSHWQGQSPQQLLTWDEIRELRQAGMTFGSHTLTHAFLADLSDAEATREISLSKDKIEQQLGEKIDFLAYPYSSLDLRIQRIVQESGYRAACSGNDLDWNLFNIWRAICHNRDSLQVYDFKAHGWYRYVIELRQNDFIRSVARGVKRVFTPPK